MAYTIISQNNNTTTLSDGVNTITVPSRVNLTSGNFTIVEVNNNMATLEDGDGNVYRDIPCVATLVDAGGGGSSLPDQTGHSGEFLTTDGTDASWAAVDSLPDQTGNSGKFLTTDGTDASWAAVDALPDQTGNSGKFLTTNGTSPSWGNALKNNINSTDQLILLSSKTTVGTQSILIGAYSYNVTGDYAISIGDHSGAVGNQGIAIGSGARGDKVATISIGAYSNANYGTITQGTYSTAVGYSSKTDGDYSIALGCTAVASGTGGIQLGYGTNANASTLSVGLVTSTSPWAATNYELMSADGTIPTARLTKVNSTITLTAADWSSNTQTVSVTGVSSTSVVLVAPDPSDTADYVAAGILCTSQTTDSLTFTATTTPTTDIDVNIVCL